MIAVFSGKERAALPAIVGGSLTLETRTLTSILCGQAVRGPIGDGHLHFVVLFHLVVQGIIGDQGELAGAGVDAEFAAGILKRVGEGVAGIQVGGGYRVADVVVLIGVLGDGAGG